MSDRNTEKGAATMAKSEFVIKPGSNEISVTRVFDGPSELVFKAMTDPDLIPKWWGPRKYWTKVDKMEAKSGGSWRFINGDDAGNEHGFHGVYHLVDAAGPVIIQTFEFEGAPDMVNIEYLWFEDLGDGRSRLRGRSICPNIEARDALLSSGMEGGMTEGYEKLDVLLKNI